MVDGRFIGDVKDSEYLSCLAGLAEAALRTKDAVVAAAAYDALEPYPDVWIVDGIAAATYGATAWTLGRLATLLGRYDEARRWLEHALRVHAAAGAAGLVAATKRALTELDAATGAGDASSAAGPTAAGPDLGELHRDGPVWRVRWAGRDATLRHSKGLADLATLLARPDTEVHVLDLVAPTGETVVQPDVGPAMDPAARAAYRHRLAELDDETDDAERDGDLGRVDRLRAEREFLVRELAGAYGLGGRARVSGDALERARKAVSQRIATALDGLEGAHPGLARHLRVSVTTGRFCAYRPDRPVRWEVTT